MRSFFGTSAVSGWLVAVFLTAFTPLYGMDRWVALSQIESGNNDYAVGAAGEISRYQVRPELWRQHAPPNADWEKPDHALAVAQRLMRMRCAEFEKSHHRPPNDFEFYVLWNAPAQIDRPSKVVRERAERFCNLVAEYASNSPPPKQ